MTYNAPITRMYRRVVGIRGLVDVAAIFERDHGRCQLCQEVMNVKAVVLDHIIPRSLSGRQRNENPNSELNLRIAHMECNIRRGAKYVPTQLRLC